MGPFGALLWILQSLALFIQLNAASGNTEVDNHIAGNALFTEVPHDIITQSGQDVEMACSFRGAHSSSVSLEIQWWYLREHREWSEKPAWTTNQVVPVEETKDATKISVVKVAGSNISHRLRLSSVKPTDEGTYECRVIDFSDNRAQHHRVRAYLQVQPPGPGAQLHMEDQQLHSEEQNHHLQKEYSQIKQKDKQSKGNYEPHHGDHKLHQKEHHKSHHSFPANGEKKQDSSSAPHHGEHHQKDQHLHEEDHHEVQEGVHHHHVNKHTKASKTQAKTHQSEIKSNKDHATENPHDCSTDDCVL